MTTDLRRAQVVFERVFDLPEPERSAVMRDLAHGDQELIEEVAALIAGMERLEDDAFLRTPILGPHLQLAKPPLTQPPPSIAGYEVFERIDAGSTGTVYRARSTGTIRRQVAIKILHPGLAASTVARFGREQEVLAALNHPGVAQVYGAGTAADGREFVAVELVTGPWITHFARAEGLSWRQCVRLIIKACQAVQVIHTHGVLHRDLKPANILIARTDAGPEPKIIDFGAAAFLDPDAVLATAHPRLVGTVAYMAPEQLRGKHTFDGRSDTYALGIVLHELLGGGHPFGAESAGLSDLVKRIDAAELPGLPRTIGPDRGELTAVIRKACAPDPDNRYPSPQHFADDLGRVLDRVPIAARPPSVLYRGRAIASRRPVTTCLALLAATIVVVLAVRVGIESSRNASQLGQIRTTMSDLIDGVLIELGELDGTHEVREHLASILLTRLDELPDDDDERTRWQRARLLDGLGDARFSRGAYADALDLRRRVLEIDSAFLDPSPDDPIRSRMVIVSMIKLGDVWKEIGEPERAESVYRDAHRQLLELSERFPEHDGVHDDLGWSYERIIPFVAQTDPAEAIQLAQIRLALTQRLVDRAPGNTLRSFGLGCAELSSAALRTTSGALDLAESHAERACGILDAVVAAQPHHFWYRSRQMIAHRARFRLMLLRDDPEVLETARRNLEFSRSFMDASPGSVLAAQAHVGALIDMASAHEAVGQSAEAQACRASAARLTVDLHGRSWSDSPEAGNTRATDPRRGEPDEPSPGG